MTKPKHVTTNAQLEVTRHTVRCSVTDEELRKGLVFRSAVADSVRSAESVPLPVPARWSYDPGNRTHTVSFTWFSRDEGQPAEYVQ